MDGGEVVPAHLAGACSRSALHPEAFTALRAAFPECPLIRLSFGLQNKVMVSVNIDMEAEGRTHASYVPIHPTAAAAAVLQNNPVVVVRQDKRSPLWDQEDIYQREGCGTVNAVSMPFYWPPAPNTQFEGAALPTPQNPAYHPTFGAMTVGSPRPLTQQSLALLVDLAVRTGRHVGPYISMLLSSLEAAGLLPSESEAQEELGCLLEEEQDAAMDDGGGLSMDELFAGEDAQAEAEADALIPGLWAEATPVGIFPSLPQQQRRAAHNMALAASAEEESEELRGAIPDWLLHQDGPYGEEAGPGGQQLAAASPADAARLQALRERGTLSPEAQLAEEVRAAAAGPPVTLVQPAALQEPPMPVMWQPAAAPQEQEQAAAPAPQPSAPAAAPEAGPSAAAAGWPAAAAARLATAARLAAAAWPEAARRPQRTALARGGPSGRSSGSGSSGAATPHRLGGQVALPGFGFALTLLLPWSNIAFQPNGLERTFVAHHNKLHERTDLAAVLLLGMGLLAAAAARMQAAWSAGVTALLLFTPYFFDLRLYHSLREMLLSSAQFFIAYFLYSLHPAALPPTHGTPLGSTSACPAHLLAGAAGEALKGAAVAAAGNGEDACSAVAAGTVAAGAAAGAAAAGRTADLSGFGILWFILHTCGLHFLLTAPLLLRLRSSRALAVQSACLALALSNLPVAYSRALGQLDTVHVLLLGLLCILAAIAGLSMAQVFELHQRQAWLQRRLQRAADTLEASGGSVPHEELPAEEEQ